MRVKFGVLEPTQRLHLHAKFHLNVFIVSVWAKNHFLGKFGHFWGLLYRPPCTDEAKFGTLEQTQGLHLHAKFHLNVFIVSASDGQKPQFLANFDSFGAPIPTPFYR